MLRLCLVVPALLLARGAAAQEVPTTELVTEEAWVPPPPTPADVRGLPPCPEGAPPAGPGEQYTCRPPMAEPGMSGSLPIELAWGGLYAGTPVQHSAIAFSAGLDFGLSRSWSIGARWQYLGGGEAVLDEDADGQDDGDETGYYSSHLVGGGPRFRLWTDETAREAWMLELDGGWAFVPNHPDLAGPYARIGLGRLVGELVGQTGAAQAALVLSYLRGFAGAEDFQSVLFGVRLQPEWGVPLPRDVDEVPSPAGFAYTLGVQGGLFGARLGEHGSAAMIPSLGLAVGFPITRALEPRLLADTSWFGSLSQRSSPLGYAGLGGMRVRLSGLLPAFVDAMGGWQVVAGPEPRDYDSGAVLDLATGLYLAGCGGAAAIGLRYRRGLMERNEDFQAIVLFFEGVYGNRRGATGADPWPTGSADLSCGGGYRPGYAATPPPPSPPPQVAAPEVDVEVPRVGGGIEVDARVPEAHAEVEVEVRPVVVEVSLGLTLFGGAVRFEIAPSSLPLGQLRDGGLVTVEIVGPPSALARAEAELRAALGPDGAHVDGWASVATDRMDVRAIFTIWPPGTRP